MTCCEDLLTKLSVLSLKTLGRQPVMDRLIWRAAVLNRATSGKHKAPGCFELGGNVLSSDRYFRS